MFRKGRFLYCKNPHALERRVAFLGNRSKLLRRGPSSNHRCPGVVAGMLHPGTYVVIFRLKSEILRTVAKTLRGSPLESQKPTYREGVQLTGEAVSLQVVKLYIIICGAYVLWHSRCASQIT